MKIEEIERLAVAATAQALKNMTPKTNPEMVLIWRTEYNRILAEFIEQEKAERGRGRDGLCWCDGPECPEVQRGEVCRERPKD